MTLEEALVKARACADNPPVNETATRRLIITRLLHAMGYEPEDYDEELHDDGGKRPDYVLLPGTGNEWYLEAKAWNVGLTPNHAAQAVSYPNHRGKRWCVLSNGQLWRLYDNQRPVELARKLVVEVGLNEPDIAELLAALSKTSAQTGGIEAYANEVAKVKDSRLRHERILARLATDLLDADSDLLVAMTASLSESLGDPVLTPAEVRDLLSQWTRPSNPSREAIVPSPDILRASVPTRAASDKESTIALLLKAPPNGKENRPAAVVMMDGAILPARSWSDMAAQIVVWMGSNRRLPCPHRSCAKTRWFLNSDSKRPDGKDMRKSRAVTTNHQTLWMDPDWTAHQFIQMLVDLGDCIGVDIRSVRVHLA